MLAKLSHTSLAPGDKAAVLCQIDNSFCRVNMREIIIRMIQKVQFITTQGKSRTLEKQIMEQKFAGVPLGKKESGPRALEFLVPVDAAPSTKSSLIQCAYCVQVTGAFEGPFTNSMNVFMDVVIRGKEEVGELYTKDVVKLPDLTPPCVVKPVSWALVPLQNTYRPLISLFKKC